MKNKNKISSDELGGRDRFEVVIYGRGGQGAKTTAELIVQAAVREGKYVQAFPDFGPERSGAPMRAFVRIAEGPIRTREPVVDPDCVLVLDETIMDSIKVTSNLTGTEPLIVNSKRDKKEIAQKIDFKGNVVVVDASGISNELIGENRPNTAILGKFCFITEVISLKNITEVFRLKYDKKLGEDKASKNIEAIKKAYCAY